MKFSGLACGDTALLALGIVALSAACVLPVEGQQSTRHDHTSRVLQDVPGNEQGDTAEVQVCGKSKRGISAVDKKLDLKAELNKPLEFSCGDGQTLAPAGKTTGTKTKFENFYATDSGGGCDVTGNAKPLETENIEASLETDSAKQRQRGAKGPSQDSEEPSTASVYTFVYKKEPQAETRLCYTCNTAAPIQGHAFKLSKDVGAAACTVHITVPGKAATTTAPTATGTGATSGARAAAFHIGAATGLLAAMLCM